MVEDRDTGKSEEQKHGIHNGSPEAPLADSAEIADLKDQLLRALAEQRNILLRAQREVREAAKFGASTLARDLLTITIGFTAPPRLWWPNRLNRPVAVKKRELRRARL